MKWLDRSLIYGPYLCLCLNEKEFKKTLKTLNCSRNIEFAPNLKGAAVHFLECEGKICCIVCISNYSEYEPIEVVGLLVHEAVHVWQEYCESIGEVDPSREFEAYAIQLISQKLMWEFDRRVNKK